MAARVFHGLNGKEILRLILSELDQELDLHPSLQRDDVTAQAVSVSWRLRVEAYPMEPPEFTVQVTRKFVGSKETPLVLSAVAPLTKDAVKAALETDTRFAGHLAYPTITWDWRISFDVESGESIQPRQAEASSPIIKSRTGNDVIDLRDRPRPTLVKPSETTDAVDLAPKAAVVGESEKDRVIREMGAQVMALQRQIDALANGTADAVSADVGSAKAEIGTTSRVANFTQSGEKIEGGSKPSPGSAMADSWGNGSAVGSMQGEKAVEVQRIEVGRQHPSLSEGGVGAPDAVRRAAGMTIPQPQATKDGGIVDMPAGSF